MSARSEGGQAITSGGYNAGGLVAYPLPDEIVVPLRREDLDTLCEGGVSEERANRDLYIGAGVGALAGLIGVLATTDWDGTWKPERRWWFLIPFLVLCVMVAISIVGASIHQGHLKRTIGNSAFSRLKARLLRLFDEPRSAIAALKSMPGVIASQIGTASGVKC
jgi:hypothetical protein